MKIEIELSDADARVFRSMASLGRYCDAVIRVCDIADGDNDNVQTVEETTELLKVPLINLHLQLREKLIALEVKPLWKQ